MRSHVIWAGVFSLILGCAAFSLTAYSKTIAVGPNHSLKQPSAAAAVARDGDVIEIENGTYVDCAVWIANGLTIVGKGNGAVVVGKLCEGKALFVVRGHDAIIRNITFTGARAPDANGAGIRAEGRNLTVQNSRFIDNENGILAGSMPGSTIRILDSRFERNGSCEKACAHGIYVNRIDLLRIERSQFLETRTAHHIKSRAVATELIGNDIRDGATGTSSYLLDIPNGGALLMEGNVLEKGPITGNPLGAVVIGAEGVNQPTGPLLLNGNTFTSWLERETAFVVNMSEIPAVLTRNRLTGKITPLVGRGTVD